MRAVRTQAVWTGLPPGLAAARAQHPQGPDALPGGDVGVSLQPRRTACGSSLVPEARQSGRWKPKAGHSASVGARARLLHFFLRQIGEP